MHTFNSLLHATAKIDIQQKMKNRVTPEMYNDNIACSTNHVLAMTNIK